MGTTWQEYVKQVATNVSVGAIVAYRVDDSAYNYFLARVTNEPFVVEEDRDI